MRRKPVSDIVFRRSLPENGCLTPVCPVDDARFPNSVKHPSTSRRADIAAGSLGRNLNTDRCLKYLGLVIFEGPIVVSVEIVDERASERITSARQCWGPDQNAILTGPHRCFMRTLGIGLPGGDGIGKRLIRLEKASVIRPVA